MRAAPALAYRLLRGSGGGGLLSIGLSVLAVSVSVFFLLLTLGVNGGFSERAEREAWLDPLPAKGEATAVQAVSTDFARGQPIAVVDLAAQSDDPPIPPGMTQFPEPGEIWMSPALADLARDLPDDQLAERFGIGGSEVRELGDEALTYPEQLVVVIGRDAADRAIAEDRPEEAYPFAPFSAAPTGVDDFSGAEPSWIQLYRILAAFATALVVVPLLVLGAAAGRLATAQRDRRLSAMRLFGATPGQVLAITTLETIFIGVIGTLLGATAYVLSLPLAAQVEARGGTWFVPDLWVGTGLFALVLAATPLVVGVSALVGMRALVVGPLGVARRQTARGTRAWRLLVFAALLVGYTVVAPSVGMSGAAPLAVAFGVIFLAFSILGPFVVGLLGRVITAFSRGPKTLLAGRRLIDDPRSGWRTVGGITLAGFVAGFMTVLVPQDISGLTDSSNVLEIVAPASQSVVEDSRDALSRAGIEGEVSRGDADIFDASGAGLVGASVEVEGGVAEVDRARTALAGVSPWQSPVSSEASVWDGARLSADITSASLLVLVVTLAVASASAAITGVTGVLDRRRTYALLRLAGTPFSVLDGARLRETLVPLLVLGGGSVATGILCALPIITTAGLSLEPGSFLKLGAIALFAVAGVALAELAGGLSLRFVVREESVRRK